MAVRDPDPGDRVLTNAVTSTTPGSDCPVGNTNDACTTTVTVLVPGLTIVKSADVTSTSPGGVVRYTITVTNSGATPHAGVLVRDSLIGAVDDATYNDDAVASDGGPVTLAGSVLSWTGDVAVGSSVTITYSVRVTGAGDRQLINAVTSDVAGSNCRTGGADTRCRSTINVLMPGLTVTHAADPATTVPGGTVNFTITITNTGQLALAAVTVTESLTGILDDASYDGDVTADSGQAGVVGDALTWTGGLAAGAQVTIRYSVTTTAAGDHMLRGTVVADAARQQLPDRRHRPALRRRRARGPPRHRLQGAHGRRHHAGDVDDPGGRHPVRHRADKPRAGAVPRNRRHQRRHRRLR